MRPLTGLSEIAAAYDAFLFDLWGVVHDGRQCYPGILPAFDALRAAGKKIALISNSPRPAASAAENIRKFGLTPDRYDLLLTSGQLTFEALRDRSDPWVQKLGARCVHIGPAHEFTPYESLGLVKTDDPAAADFLFITGLENSENLDAYTEILTACLKANLPLLCANPDKGVVKDGKPALAAAALVDAYAERGGDARAPYGKPHPDIFRRALGALGAAPGRAIMIGDNLATDIAGAAGTGIPTVWIYGGVHLHDLGGGLDIAPEKLQDFLAQHHAQADYSLPRVSW